MRPRLPARGFSLRGRGQIFFRTVKEPMPHTEGIGAGISGVVPPMPAAETPQAPWSAIERLVAATDRTSLQEAVLCMMEGMGLDCPHLALADGGEGAWRIAAHRGVPETLLEQVQSNVEEVAGGLSEKMPRFLPGGLLHHIASIRREGELLGLVGWLCPEDETAPEIGPIEGLVRAALQRFDRGAKQRRRSSQREAVRRAALAVGEARDLGGMLEAIAERTRLLTGAPAVAVRGRGVDSEEDSWLIRGGTAVSSPRPELWPHKIAIRHQGRQLAELRLRAGAEGQRPTEDDLALGRLFAEHVGALVASASAKSRLMREVSAQTRTVRLLGSVVEHLPVATLLIHPAPEGPTTWLNRRAKSLLGCEDQVTVEALKPLLRTQEGRDFLPPAHPIARVLRGERIHRQEAQLVAHGEEGPRFVVFHGEPITGSDHCLAAVIALEDVSAFKTLERMREQWASLITHDLRQPLTSILGFASLLAQKEDLDPSIRHKITVISAAARRLVRISRDLLDASLMDARQLGLERTETDICHLARNLADELSHESGELPIRLVFGPDIPRVVADPVRIEQVLENLLSNARKYGRPGSEVILQVEKVDEEVRVHVRNRGEAILPDEEGRIFSRFYRGQNALRTTAPGMGLGLYICRALIEAHGGRIWAANQASDEVVFSFALPLPSHARPRAH